MKQYITRTGENIFDICLMLYGDQNGLLDLLLSNPSLNIDTDGPQELVGQPLSFNTELKKGVILNYHSDFIANQEVVNNINRNNIIIANGSGKCGVVTGVPKIIVNQSGVLSRISGIINSGNIMIDWGDDSQPEQFNVGPFDIEHAYRDSGSHTIGIYGNFKLDTLDFTELNGIYYATEVISVQTFNTPLENSALNSLFTSKIIKPL